MAAKKRKAAAKRGAGVPEWRAIVGSALDWRQAHATLDDAARPDNFPPGLRGKRPPNFPHSAWELLEHIRLTQTDLAEFLTDEEYQAPEWPAGYWPDSPVPPSDDAWDESLAAIRRETRRIKRVASKPGLDLTKAIPWGEGQTYLRTILVSIDHTAYHVGQLIAVRRLLGVWEGK